MKRIHRLFAVGVAIMGLALVPSLALGFSLKHGDNIALAKGDTNHGSMYVAGQNITIDGDVDGDLWCAGNTININGIVHGDVLCGGQTITINGTVDGNVRVAGQTVGINGAVAHNVSVATQAFTLGSNAKVAGEVALIGQTATISGPVGRDVYGALASLNLAAPVRGSVTAQVDDLTVSSNARVDGDLTYTSSKTVNVDASKVGGKVTRHEPPKHATESPRATFLGWLTGAVYWMLASLLVALVLIWLMPRLVRTVTGTMSRRPGASVGLGLVVMFAGPLAIIALLITIIGIPLAVLAGGLWLLALGVSGVFVGIAAGLWILGRTDWRDAHGSLVWAAVVGIPVTILVFAIPVLGGLLSLVAAWWALGGQAISLAESKS